ncbi:MAG: adenylate/guanylate cyclase domain-containing protein [Betaproteobacteria bacterium]|nr:adenylate/guanylate cyclase domain-containing protein [Betaproteobacteria bacterium]
MGLWRVPLFIGLAGSLLSLLLASGLPWPSTLQRAANLLGDQWHRMSASDSLESRVVIVDIDEASLKALGAWPWERKTLANLLTQLFETHQVAAIGLDLVLPEPRDREGDQAIQQLLERYPLVLSQAFGLGQSQAADAGEVSSHWPKHIQLASGLAIAQASGHVGHHAGLQPRCTGHISWLPEDDGVVRRLPPLLRYRDQWQATLSLAVLACMGLLPDQVKLEPRWPAGQVLSTGVLDLASDPQGFWSIPYTRSNLAWLSVPSHLAFEAREPISALRGALVLIGSSALGVSDRVATPMAASQAGVVVHAQATAALLDIISQEDPRARSSWHGVKAWLLIQALSLLSMALIVVSCRFRRYLSLALIGLFASVGLALLALMLTDTHQLQLVGGPPIAVTLCALASLAWSLRNERQTAGRLRRLFADYVPPKVLEHLLSEGSAQTLAPSREQLVVMFVDAVGSTRLARQDSPELFAQKLRTQLDAWTSIVHQHGGTLDKYLGDGLMVFWGAPLRASDDADRALQAALAIQAAPGLSKRIGMASGEALVGDLGTTMRRSYTALGEVVNRAERLQREAPADGILLDQQLAERIKHHQVQACGARSLPGYDRDVETYRPV